MDKDVRRTPVNVEQLLVEAADAATAQDVSIEAFTLAAVAAYLRADTELWVWLWDRTLLEQLEALRRGGRLPVA